MKTVLLILEELSKVSGRLAKEKLLKTHETNVKLQKVFKLTYGEQRYGVYPSEILKTEEFLKRKNAPLKLQWKDFKKLTTNLVERKITGNKAKKAVDAFLIIFFRPESAPSACFIFLGISSFQY